MSQESFIMKLNGGLGNQMFQWALARMIQETTDMNFFLDMSYFKNSYARPYQLDIFKVKPDFVNSISTKIKLNIIWTLRNLFANQKILGYNLFMESKFNFDSGIHRIKSDTYITGFFQTEKYFKNIESVIRADFQFKELPDGENQKNIKLIHSSPSISLHIRRGDYVEKQRYSETYAKCSLNYYKNAVEYITQSCPNPTLFVFSDDIEWVKKHLKLPFKTIYISNNTGKKSFEDMRLMSLCTHNIIANSSFSWWGAWLNNNKDKIVIAPKKWFNDSSINQDDVIPKEWIRIDN